MAKETRKKRQGRVVRNTMDKTVIVAVEWRQRHPLYRKSVRRITRSSPTTDRTSVVSGRGAHRRDTAPSPA